MTTTFYHVLGNVAAEPGPARRLRRQRMDRDHDGDFAKCQCRYDALEHRHVRTHVERAICRQVDHPSLRFHVIENAVNGHGQAHAVKLVGRQEGRDLVLNPSSVISDP